MKKAVVILVALLAAVACFSQTDQQKREASLEKVVVNQTLVLQEIQAQNEKIVSTVNAIIGDISALPAGFAPLDSLRKANGIKFDEEKKYKKAK